MMGSALQEVLEGLGRARKTLEQNSEQYRVLLDTAQDTEQCLLKSSVLCSLLSEPALQVNYSCILCSNEA